ncbi:MAG: hypothetical protein A2X12_01615 [Bacteroidetes bacterium GWE2_29_8]|nr:MAG: hypothetical protein A2X12_01615 [Bacteroidetes bacterium GWE2_29_8]
MDDYAFIGYIRDYGFMSPFTYWYPNWQGRLCPQFLVNTILKIYEVIPSMIPYLIFMTMGFVAGVYLILKLYFKGTWVEKLNISIFLFLIFIMSALDFNTFFWLNVSTMYYGGVLFTLFGVYAILNPNYNNKLLAILILSFIYAGMSAEHYGALLIAAFSCVLLFIFYQYKFRLKEAFTNVYFRKIFLALIVISISFVIMISSPGNKVRMSAFEQPSIIELITIAYKTFKIILFQVFILKSPYWVITFFTALYFGKQFKEKIHINKSLPIFPLILLGLLIFIVLVWVCILPTTYAQGLLAANRTLIIITIYMTCFVFAIGVLCGIRYSKNNLLIKLPFILSQIGLMIIFLSCIKIEVPLAKKYSDSDKARVKYLTNLEKSGFKGTALIEPLYNPYTKSLSSHIRTFLGLPLFYRVENPLTYIVGDIGESRDWRNFHIEYGLNLSFPIQLDLKKKFNDNDLDSIEQISSRFVFDSNATIFVNYREVIYIIDTLKYGYSPNYIKLNLIPDRFIKRFEKMPIVYDFMAKENTVIYSGNKYKGKLILYRELPFVIINEIETSICKDINEDNVVKSFQLRSSLL